MPSVPPAASEPADSRPVVFPLHQLRQRHAADRRRGRHRGTADRREQRAADDVGLQQSAGQARDDLGEASVDPERQAAALHQFRHQDEQRNGGQGEAVHAAPGDQADAFERGGRAASADRPPRAPRWRTAPPCRRRAAAGTRQTRRSVEPRVPSFSSRRHIRERGATMPQHRYQNARIMQPSGIRACGIHNGVASKVGATSPDCQVCTV